jgi:predicted nucleic acid-binding protein
MIFVDTSFWIAAHVQRDQHHEQAKTLLRGLGSEPLITSNHVRGETWTWFRRKTGHAAAVSFLDRLERSAQAEVVSVTEEMERRSLGWLRKHDEREYSFVDATSFAVMRSLKIRHALAFDGDFTAAGFTELRASAP